MIVDPDFLDHWRTGMVADAINDQMAAIYILRLWAHCQDRKSDTFIMPTAGLKAQCKCPASAEVFERALVEAGFLKRDGDTITVIGWAEKNASLIAAWENGSKGGRPKKNPTETQQKPMGNQAATHGQPIANPGETDKRREEKNSPSLRSGESAPRASRKCPASFEITPDLERWAAENAPGVNLQRETEKFRDHTFKTAYSDWHGTWRNWIRKAADSLPRARASPGESFRERDARLERERYAELTGKRPALDGNTIDMPAQLALEHEQ